MNPPSAMTRFIGTRKNAAVLYIVFALAVLGWMVGAVPWWLGLIALASVGRIVTATRQVKTYDAWAADWNAMGGLEAPVGARPAKKPVSRGMLAAQAAGFFIVACVIWNMTPPGQKTPDGQAVMWFLMMGGFVGSTCKLIAAARRDRPRDRQKVKNTVAGTKDTAADVVEWALPPASSSPSRADAERSLPDYAARLLTSGPQVVPLKVREGFTKVS